MSTNIHRYYQKQHDVTKTISSLKTFQVFGFINGYRLYTFLGFTAGRYRYRPVSGGKAFSVTELIAKRTKVVCHAC